MMRYLTVGFVVIVFMSSCSEVVLGKDEINSLLDLNKDGIEDIFYENVPTGEYEMIDRNFDGRVDQSNFYDLAGVIQTSKSDNDFDGFLETRYEYLNGFVVRGVVDSNQNGYTDIMFFYKGGITQYAKRYISSGKGKGETKIGTTYFLYEYPTGKENLVDVDIQEFDFESFVRQPNQKGQSEPPPKQHNQGVGQLDSIRH